MARTQVYLVRHGEQAGGEGGRRNGLSAVGRDQADRLGRRLKVVPFAAIHHSPLARAVETADIVADRLARVPRHACDHVVDRTPVPSPARRDEYPERAGTRGSTVFRPTNGTRTRRRSGPPSNTSG